MIPTTRLPTKVQPLSVLVTNDDGYDAPGLDAVVTELRALPGVTVTVVAPGDEPERHRRQDHADTA